METDLVDLDRRLRASRIPAGEPDPWLHAAIMNEVGREASRAAAPRAGAGWRPAWAWGLACLLLIVAGLSVRFLPGHSSPPTLAAHSEADELLRRTATEGAVTLVEPMDTELTNLTHDLDRATDFLLASLP